MMAAPATSPRLAARTGTALLMFAVLALIGTATGYADPNVLWNIVHGKCVPNELQNGKPDPCAAVDLRGGEQAGYAVLKDLVGATQFLLIPTARITGIESPLLLAPDAPNYFAFAWEARSYIDNVLHRTMPRDDISLAVNSVSGRTQDQLHIHIDCVRADVRDALRKNGGTIRDKWAPFPVPLGGHRYIAMSVEGEQLGQANPFKLLAEGWPIAKADMADQTLVVVGGTFSDSRAGFFVLDDRADPAKADKGSGEDLQDHNCAVARL
ncbi:MAG TPA: CDP-diacylglycerol diphosphatase [bacterium]|nr:CDP-diacylglycerol diphosphatase [bacterium]